jgi:hypothetical protein
VTGDNLRLHLHGAAGDIQTMSAVHLLRATKGSYWEGWGPRIEPTCSSANLGDLENQFSADVASVDHPMPTGSFLQRKHFNRR